VLTTAQRLRTALWPDADGETRLLWAAPAALGLAMLLANVAYVHRFTVDDAYITLRYSRNVAEGLGPIYNAVGPRAEGYTSFLWMAILAVPHLLHVDALLVAKALGVVVTLATCALLFVWASSEARGAAARPFAGGMAVAAYAALPRTAIHAVSGMETALFTFLLSAALFACARYVRDGRAWSKPFLFASIAASLTRPEASVAMGAAAATALVLVPAEERRLAVRTWIPVLFGSLVAYELWRIRYYGLPAPLPFYVKLGSAVALPGAEPVDEWLRSELPIAAPVSIALVTFPKHLRPPLVAVVILAVFFLFPRHLMGYDSRYLSPLDPAMCVLFGIGLGRLVAPRTESDGQGESSWMLAAAAAGLPLLVSASQARSALSDRIDYADGLSAAHVALGGDLARLGLPDRRLALSDAGAIPYLSGWWTLDLVGLNEPHIAITGKCDPAWVLSQSPDVVVLVSIDAERFVPDEWNAYERPLYDALVAAGFVKVGMRTFASDYLLWVLAKPGTVTL
jgi:arabinofuranosyltransferase